MELVKFKEEHREQFIKDLQWAFSISVNTEFGDDGKEVISRKEIEDDIAAPNAQTFVALEDDKIIGGCIVSINADTQINTIDLLYVNPNAHSKGIGLKIWQTIEQMFPQTKKWQTYTPYFEQRNINFYVNKCGFKIIEFFCSSHQNPDFPIPENTDRPTFHNHFKFEKEMPVIVTTSAE